MKPVAYYVPSEFTSPKLAYAFAKGCGGTITDDLDYLFDGPVALFGSPPVWPLLRRAQAEGREYYFADHGYFSHGKYYRITKNGYQHDGRGTSNGDRFHAFQRLCKLKPWRTSGSHIVVCPNSAVYFGLHGIDVEQWLAEVTTTLREYTDREIRIRWKVQRADRPIAMDLENAWAVVVFSSAAALDGLIAGVPCFTLAPFAASVRMGLSDLSQIETPFYPEDREEFLSVLADNQWTIQEILCGKAWLALQHEECDAN